MHLDTRDGRVLVLRGVTMKPRTVCGVEVMGAGKRRCIGYDQVVQARSAEPPTRLDPLDAGLGRRATELQPNPR